MTLQEAKAISLETREEIDAQRERVRLLGRRLLFAGWGYAAQRWLEKTAEHCDVSEQEHFARWHNFEAEVRNRIEVNFSRRRVHRQSASRR